MTRPARRPALIEPEEPPPGPDDALAVALTAATQEFAPAIQAIAKFMTNLDARLDALCNWLKSVKPWAIGLGIWAVTRFAPDLADALGPLIQGTMQ